ncbi:MAG: transglutaminase-like domain-containing protein [Chloroflexota bacterium]
MANPLEFYAAHGVMTDPRAPARLFGDLPRDVAALCKIVQGLMVHIFWAERYGLVLPDERKNEVQIRPVARKLARILELDPRPLTEPRTLDRKLVGNCRDFTVMLVAMLQHQGVPARARCGFGTYFLPNHYEDHWVGEFWDAAQNRWILVDAQLDAFQRDALTINFDPLDVPRDQFIVGGKAWQMCRAGQADPNAFGIFNMHGLWFVRGDFIRDVAALNQMELLPWDCWGLIDIGNRNETAEELAFLDRVAALTTGDVPEFDAVRALYESDERLRVPPVITAYVNGGAQKIELANEIGA